MTHPNPHLEKVSKARTELTSARDHYNESVHAAVDAGLSPPRIAEAAGVTEGAIRQTIKRST